MKNYNPYSWLMRWCKFQQMICPLSVIPLTSQAFTPTKRQQTSQTSPSAIITIPAISPAPQRSSPKPRLSAFSSQPSPAHPPLSPPRTGSMLRADNRKSPGSLLLSPSRSVQSATSHAEDWSHVPRIRLPILSDASSDDVTGDVVWVMGASLPKNDWAIYTLPGHMKDLHIPFQDIWRTYIYVSSIYILWSNSIVWMLLIIQTALLRMDWQQDFVFFRFI